MKKKIFIFLCLILLNSGCNNHKEINNFDISISKIDIYGSVGFNEYYSNNDQKIYITNNIEEVYITTMDGTKETLSHYIGNVFQTFDNSIKSITNKLELVSSLRDGGTQIYKSKDKDITLIACHIVNGNNNVYIGDYDMQYNGECSYELTQTKPNNTELEKFFFGHTLNDGRLISFSFNVPYKSLYLNNPNDSSSLHDALMYDKITIHDFLNKLDLIAMYKDGGSKLYKYNKSKQYFGAEDFYVIVCNSLDGINDIWVAKNKESVTDKCTLKINDLEGVSMTIKEGTLTKESATVIIKDISNRQNVYGIAFELEKQENGIWNKMPTLHDLLFTCIGYHVDENHTLEFTVNWEYNYGTLDSGKYRILKDTSEAGEGTRHYITAEFIIN